jgi:hypothetical protein
MQFALCLRSLCPFEIPGSADAFSMPPAVVHQRVDFVSASSFRLCATSSSSSSSSSDTDSAHSGAPSSSSKHTTTHNTTATTDTDTDTDTSTATKKEFVSQATIQFNNKLNAMARKFDDSSAQEVENLLRKTLQQIEMGLELEIEPNVVSFTAAISAWARSSHRDAAQRAEAILDWMRELSESDDNLYLKNVAPNAYAYNAAISAWIRSGNNQRNQKNQKNHHHKNNNDSHTQAERLLNQLWESYEATQDAELKPNARSFNLVINAIARSREPGCADRAAALLNRMEELYLAGDDELEPDALTFGAIINAYANAGVRGSSDKAAQILQRMESLYQLGYQSVKPNTFVYNACLNAFAKSSQDGKAIKANQLLTLMEQQYYRNGDASVKPDVITYSTCINAHASSQSTNAGKEADALIQRMVSLYLLGDHAVKPNAIAYTASIKAWVTAASVAKEDEDPTTLQKQAAERAVDILQRMILQYLAGDPQLKPTKVTFDLVCQALSKIQDEDKIEEVEKLRRRVMGMKTPRRDSV